VILNLVINAAQASPPGSNVWLTASASEDRVSITVSDEGCGIPPDKQDKVFDPFYTTKENGTGLGLAIASMIVEQHRGILTAQNNPEKGMTFRIELPIDRTRRI
jgi:two-component system, NtrC family, sensor histidine kinase HydH